MSNPVARLAAELHDLKTQVRAGAMSPQLAYSSVEDGGAIDVKDADGNLATSVGAQWDGSYGVVPLTGPVPPTPSAPQVEAVEGGLRVRWDGYFADADFPTMDMTRIEVHASDWEFFDPATADYLRATIETPRGGEVLLQLPPEQHWVCFITRSAAGKSSPASEIVSGTPLAVVTAEELAAIDLAVQVAQTDVAAVVAEVATIPAQLTAVQNSAGLDAQGRADLAKAQAIAAAGTDAVAKANAAQLAAVTAAAADAKVQADAAKAAAIAAAALTAQDKADLAKAQALSGAATDAQTKASAAQAAAIAAAATDAQTKATQAKTDAITAAALTAQDKADLAKAAAISAAASDATTKANNAQTAAVNAAATTAQQKADAAKQAAIDSAALTAQAKADTAKAEALTSAAVTAQQKADAAAATAKAEAITAAAADAQAKADAAKAAALAAAAVDATDKADLAQANAIAQAALITNKVNNPTRTGTTAGWVTTGGATITVEDKDFNGTTIKAMKVSAAGNGSVESAIFESDSSKAYEYRMWVLDPTEVAGNTQLYFGASFYNMALSARTVQGYYQTTGAAAGSPTTNFYGFTTSPATPAWKEVVFWALPSDASVPSDTANLGVNGTSNAIVPTDTVRAKARILNWLNTGTSRDLWLANITVREMPLSMVRNTLATEAWRYQGTVTMDGGKIAADTVTASQVKAGAIIAGKLAADAVLANNIKAGEVIAGKLGVDAVVATNIKAGEIVAGKIATDAVTAGTIAAGSVVAGKVAADAILAANIKAGEIAANHLSANSVTAGKIATDAVTAGTIAAGAVVAGKIAASAVTATELAADSVTAVKIQANAVVAGKLAADSVLAASIKAGEIASDHLSANSVTAGKIATDAVTANTIVANAVTTAKIATNAVTANEIASNTIIADNIKAGEIIAGKLAANAVVAGNVAARSIGADHLTIGSSANLVPGGCGEFGTVVGTPFEARTGVSFSAAQLTTGIAGYFNATASTGTVIPATMLWDVEPSSEYLVEIWVKATAANSRMYVELRDQAGAHATLNTAVAGEPFAGAAGYPMSNLIVPTVWTKYSSIATTTATATKMKLGSIYFNHSAGTATATQSIAIRVRPRNAGKLIVDGSILAAHIKAGEITANEIKAGTITAAELKAGTITAASGIIGSLDASKMTTGTLDASLVNVTKINAANITVGAIQASQLSATAIDGKVITGSTLKTSGTGERVEVVGGGGASSNRVSFYGATYTSPTTIQHAESTDGADGLLINTPRVDISGTDGAGWTRAGHFSVKPTGSMAWGVLKFNQAMGLSQTYSGVSAGSDGITELRGAQVKISSNVIRTDGGSTWVQPTLGNSWQNYGAPFSPASYRKNIDGSVELRGLVRLGTLNAAIFTLPVGFRPEYTEIYLQVANASSVPGVARVQVAASGGVTVVSYTSGSTNGFVSLTGMRFDAP